VTAAKAAKIIWIPVVDLATSKDPTKFWQVQRRPGTSPAVVMRDIREAVKAQDLRCLCPSYIFKTRNSGYEVLCKHLLYVESHPSLLIERYQSAGTLASVGKGPATEAVVDPFGALVREKFLERMKARPGLGFTSLGFTIITGLATGAEWNAFVDDLRLVAPNAMAKAVVPVAGVERLRRIIMED